MPNQQSKKRVFVAIIPLFVIITLSLLTIFNLYNFLKPEAEVLSVSTSLEAEAAFWKTFLDKNPDYIPGWEEFAKISKDLNQTEDFNKAINKIRELDPNREESFY
jgi:hypothetical protein